MNWVKIVSMIVLACFLASKAQAEVIEVPQEELAKESVLPVFDHPVMVKNRSIVTDGRMDFNFAYGMALSEPIYNVNRYTLSGYYNTSESNAFGLIYEKMAPGLSTYANQLNSQFNLDFKRAPSPEQALLFDWNWKMYYGKMSITKRTVLNTILYVTVAGGMLKFTHKMYPVVAPGFGQKFFFSKNLALRFDFRLHANQAPIPFLDTNSTSNGASVNENKPIPTADQFNERLTYTTVLNAGLTWQL